MFFVSCVSHALVSVHCCLVVNSWERADLLALVGDVLLSCQVWYLIVSFPDLWLPSYLCFNEVIFISYLGVISCHVLNLKAPIMTAADDKFATSFLIFEKS